MPPSFECSNMIIKQFVFSPFQENTYVVYADNLEAMIIDPGCYQPSEEKKLQEFVESNGLIVKHLVNTHLHLDHTFGNVFVEETWGVRTAAHIGDDYWLKDMTGQCRKFGMEPLRPAPSIGIILKEGDRILLGTESFEVLEVPGHSPGCIALYNAARHCLFSGDSLFYGSIGRTDFPGGDYQQLIQGIQEKLLTLPDETAVYPGHGPFTSIGNERSSNPFL
jgi:hydroxyacylglutathione hydrolase